MARKRMIDPTIWTDEGMAQLDARQQLLFIGLFANADDAGRLKGSATALRLMLPTIYGGLMEADVASDLAAVLAAMRHLVRYTVEDRVYLAFRNYDRWQRIEHLTPSRLPPPPLFNDGPALDDGDESSVTPDQPSAPGASVATHPASAAGSRSSPGAGAGASPRSRRGRAPSKAQSNKEQRNADEVSATQPSAAPYWAQPPPGNAPAEPAVMETASIRAEILRTERRRRGEPALEERLIALRAELLRREAPG